MLLYIHVSLYYRGGMENVTVRTPFFYPYLVLFVSQSNPPFLVQL